MNKLLLILFVLSTIAYVWVFSYVDWGDSKARLVEPERVITNCPYGDSMDKATCEKFEVKVEQLPEIEGK